MAVLKNNVHMIGMRIDIFRCFGKTISHNLVKDCFFDAYTFQKLRDTEELHRGARNARVMTFWSILVV